MMKTFLFELLRFSSLSLVAVLFYLVLIMFFSLLVLNEKLNHI